jgi:hypothetical protein
MAKSHELHGPVCKWKSTHALSPPRFHLAPPLPTGAAAQDLSTDPANDAAPSSGATLVGRARLPKSRRRAAAAARAPHGAAEPRLPPDDDGPGEGPAAELKLRAALRRGEPQQVLVTYAVPPPPPAGRRQAGTGDDRAARVGGINAVKASVLLAGGGGGAQDAPGVSPQLAARVAAAGAVASPTAAPPAPPRARGWRLKHDYSEMPISLFTVESEAALDDLRSNPQIAGVEADQAARPQLRESLPLVYQPQAVAAGFGGEGCSIAIIDTGGWRAACGFLWKVPGSWLLAWLRCLWQSPTTNHLNH